MAHELGTTTTEIDGASGGSDGGPFSRYTGTSVSGLARRAAPPKNPFAMWKRLAKLSGAFVVASLVAMRFGGLHDFEVHPVAGSLSIALGLADIVFVPMLVVSLAALVIALPKRARYGADRARWEKSWICTGCGNIFVPATAAE